jgi:ketosteroid isomerase-like protein
MISESCKQAYQALRDNRSVRLPGECVEPLLYWLCGSHSGPAESVYKYLGSPFDDVDQVQRVYQALEAVLFKDDELLPLQVGSYEQYNHFRLLSRVYHPDRYPELANWLGPRAQTINAAFNAFKQEQGTLSGDEAGIPLFREQGEARPLAGQDEEFFDVHVGMQERFIRASAPLASSRHLPQKILILTAILCALPLLYLYLQRPPKEPYVWGWTGLPAKHYAAASNPATAGIEMAADTDTRSEAVTDAIDVMGRFRESFEGGYLQDLLDLTAATPRENKNTGKPWFRRSYGDLFAHTRSRSLALYFNNTIVDGNNVWLVGRYDIHIVYRDGQAAAGSGSVRYGLISQNKTWKISAIDYHREQ